MSNNDIVKQLLREYGNAVRGDWSDIDGRSVRSSMDDFADMIDSVEPVDVAQWRFNEGICPAGKGHWDMHCGADCGAHP